MRAFKLEEYFVAHEFSAQYLLCCSDAESWSMAEIIAMAPEKELWENLRLGYTECQGLPRLRQSIVQNLYQGLNADDILVFTGAEEGIFCALNAMLTPSDHVVVITPCYQSLSEIPQSIGCSITKLELLPEEKWQLDLERLKEAILPNTKAVIINFPHNPTGKMLNDSELKDLVDICRAHDLWLFSDEAYRPLGEPSLEWAPPAAMLYSKAMSLGVMSKAYGLAGLRIGWIACQDKEAIKKIMRFKNYTTICNSAPSEILALMALENQEKILSRNNQIVTENLSLLDDFMAKYSAIFAWVRPQAGCVGFVEYKKRQSVDELCAELLAKKNTLLLPASIYEYEGNYFRIGFGRKNMPKALSLLEEFIKG